MGCEGGRFGQPAFIGPSRRKTSNTGPQPVPNPSSLRSGTAGQAQNHRVVPACWLLALLNPFFGSLVHKALLDGPLA